jgi:hypothetical protein
VYPLLPGGNLDDRLHRSADALERVARLQRAETHSVPQPPGAPLGWRERLRICRDASRGLLYLHTPTASKGVVHQRDPTPHGTTHPRLCCHGILTHARQVLHRVVELTLT